MDIFLSVVGVMTIILVAIIVFAILATFLPTVLTIATLEALAIFGGGYLWFYIDTQYIIPNSTILQNIGANAICLIAFLAIEAGFMFMMQYVASFSSWAKAKMGINLL